jgi:hypothetical protein
VIRNEAGGLAEAETTLRKLIASRR